MKTYHELISLPTYAERLRYLQLSAKVGAETFGRDRILNQALYHSSEWRRLKDQIILRDQGCDLAVPGLFVFDRVYIHHINPVTKEDIIERRENVLDPENLISCSFATHQMIHFGFEKPTEFTERMPNDTAPWKVAR